MAKKLTYILSIAGHDPSGGAGLLADIKVFEHHRLMGFGVATAITYQNEREFTGVNWLSTENIIQQVQPLSRYQIDVVKIGLIKSLQQLSEVINEVIKIWPGVRIIWDPILKASAGFAFHENIDKELLQNILTKVYLITPNRLEAEKLGQEDAIQNAIQVSHSCHVLLKGGHLTEHSNDQLYTGGRLIKEYVQARLYGVEKHGSGCVLSSAIAANLALGKEIETACKDAKEYTKDFLISNETLLGQHSNPLIA